MTHTTVSHGSDRRDLIGIAVVLLAYGAAALAGWPQKGAEMVARQAAGAHGPDQQAGPAGPGEQGEAAGPAVHPPYWAVLPFVLLLGAIAVLPLVPRTAHWWESNLHRLYVAAGLGAVTLLVYLLVYEQPVESHWPATTVVEPAAGGPNLATTAAVLGNAILSEYVPFIVLLFSLFTISGGIRIEGDLPARPLTNAALLAIGGALASLIGTTGAAMVLVRPLLETNRERKRVVHTVVFFVFVVCNCGGCLLPLGDPPLFLGYLRGVPFLWTLKRLWPEWLFVNVLLVAVYYLWDRFWAYPREARRDIAVDETRTHRLRFAGLWPNALLLLGVIFSIALLDPSKPLPGTGWRPWLYLREAAQLGLVGLSLWLGHPATRRQNRFNYHAILEVAALFLGIFITMQPALQILHVKGRDLGLTTPVHFFWATGSLSSVLDNAPTYVVFMETARSLGGSPGEAMVAGVAEPLLAAVALGAVFMGAMTYIGNGPNFMVKAIAEHSGVRMPSFFGYLLYSFAVLVPILAVTTWLFFCR